jgi:hypothetical protein
VEKGLKRHSQIGVESAEQIDSDPDSDFDLDRCVAFL